MTAKVEFLLNEALSMSFSDRALMAHRLISGIDEPIEKDIEIEWIKLAKKRLYELENHQVEPVTWNELKQRVRNA